MLYIITCMRSTARSLPSSTHASTIRSIEPGMGINLVSRILRNIGHIETIIIDLSLLNSLLTGLNVLK